MTITKYGDRWRVQENVGRRWDGKTDRPSKVCATLKEARKIQAEYDLLKLQNQGKAYGMNFRDFVEKVFLPAKTSLTYDTLRAYRRDINLRLIPAFGHLNILEINCLRIQQAISLCPTKKTALNMRNTLRTILNMAMQLQVITTNPAMGEYRFPDAIRPTVAKWDEGWLTTFAEHRKVLEAAQGDPAEPILLLGLCSGLRRGEILAMEWGDVDFDRHELTVRQTYVRKAGGHRLKEPKTENSCRIVPLTAYEEERLKALKKTVKVRTIKGETPAGIPVVALSGARLLANMPNVLCDRFFKAHPELKRLTILSLRHSFATASIRAGIEVSIVSRWLGHANVTTTYNRYVKPQLKDLKNDVSLIDSAFLAEKIAG